MVLTTSEDKFHIIISTLGSFLSLIGCIVFMIITDSVQYSERDEYKWCNFYEDAFILYICMLAVQMFTFLLLLFWCRFNIKEYNNSPIKCASICNMGVCIGITIVLLYFAIGISNNNHVTCDDKTLRVSFIVLTPILYFFFCYSFFYGLMYSPRSNGEEVEDVIFKSDFTRA